MMLKPKFLLDENLNRLAKWLRMLGYDAAVYKSINIHNKIRLVNRERRIYLTRDKTLAKKKEKFTRVLIKSEKHLEQLKEILDYISYNEEFVFTRCIDCNRILYDISKGKIKELIPPFVLENHSHFKVCRKCGKVFWMGTHYQEMKKELKNILTI